MLFKKLDQQTRWSFGRLGMLHLSVGRQACSMVEKEMRAVNAPLSECLCLASKPASWLCRPVLELIANTWCVQVLRGGVYIAQHLVVRAPK
jgi:hypothetical protein